MNLCVCADIVERPGAALGTQGAHGDAGQVGMVEVKVMVVMVVVIVWRWQILKLRALLLSSLSANLLSNHVLIQSGHSWHGPIK